MMHVVGPVLLTDLLRTTNKLASDATVDIYIYIYINTNTYICIYVHIYMNM